jgi:hypothetical protein
MPVGSVFWQVVQGNEVHEGCYDFVLEADPGSADAVATTENQLVQVFNTILVTPKHLDGAGNARVMCADDSHLVINLDLARQFLQGHGACGFIRFVVVEFWKKASVFAIDHAGWYSRCDCAVGLACSKKFNI